MKTLKLSYLPLGQKYLELMLKDIDTLTIAVPKGRVLEEIIPLFDIINLSFFDNPFKSRKLIFKTSNPKIRIILLRPQDVATYVYKWCG